MKTSVVRVQITIGVLLLATHMLSGCGSAKGTGSSGSTQPPSDSVDDTLSSLKGTVEVIAGGSSSSKPLRATKKTDLRAFSCTTPMASVYTLNSQGQRDLPAKATTSVDANGAYEFKNLSSLGLRLSGTTNSTPLLVDVSGCSEDLARIVTGSSSQNIHYGTTLIAWVAQSERASAIAAASREKLSQLMELLKAETSQTAAYSTLASNSTLSALFAEAFGASPNVLEDAAPSLLSSTIPTTGSEQVALSLSASAQHWRAGYSLIYEWHLGSSLLSTGQNTTWTPSDNSQGTRTLTLFIGKDNGSGHIDTAKPYTSKAFTVQIANAHPAVAPAVSLLTPSHTNNPSVTLRITTGAAIGASSGVSSDDDYAHCSTFSKLALVESDDLNPNTSAPVAESAYTISCSQAGTQDLNHTLTTGTGTKTLRLWARDSAGNVSATPSIVTVSYSTAGPFGSYRLTGFWYLHDRCPHSLRHLRRSQRRRDFDRFHRRSPADDSLFIWHLY